MRSRASQARALFRVAGHSSSARAVASAPSASVAGPISSSSSASDPAARLEHHGRAGSSRRGAQSGKSEVGKRSAGPSRSVPRSSSSQQARLPTSKIVTIRSLPKAEALLAAAKSNAKGGIILRPPVRPPPSTISSVASEAFFASHRPLLQHELMSDEAFAKWTPQMTAEFGLETAKRMLRDSLSSFDAAPETSASSSSSTNATEKEQEMQDFLSTVLDGLDNSDKYGIELSSVIQGGAGGSQPMPIPWRRPIRNLSAERFNKILDTLSKGDGTSHAVVAEEASRLDEEEAARIDREQAVAAALERGEDITVAQSLGSEADLIVLGEPSGPDPKWARGVATHLAEKTRALQPPPPPTNPKSSSTAPKRNETALSDEEDSQDIFYLGSFVAESYDADVKLPKHLLSDHGDRQATFGEDDNPTLMFSHALVQSHLPKALAWDAIVDKMNSASLDPSSALQSGARAETRSVVDVTKLNADLRKEASEEGEDVLMDSVKRKRRKKMRKHKYRKLRKRTRVERTRLKK